MEYIESKYFSYADPDDPWYRKLIIRCIESMAGQPALFKLYREYQENSENWDNFWHGCLEQLQLKLDFNNDKLEIKGSKYDASNYIWNSPNDCHRWTPDKSTSFNRG